MADVAEQQVRDAIVNKLREIPLITNDVYPHRYYPMSVDIPQAILVYTGQENMELDTQTRPRGKTHVLEVRIEVLIKNTGAVEDLVSAVFKEIIPKLEADVTLNGLVQDLMNTRNVKDFFADGGSKEVVEGEKKAIAGVMTWVVQYRTREGVPDQMI